MEKFLYRWFLPFVLAFILSLFLYLFFKDKICYVGGNAMNPFFKKGQIVLVKNATDIKKNDIVLLDNPLRKSEQSQKLSLKRCVALPGDTVEIIDKKLYVNHRLQDSYFCQFDRTFFFYSQKEVEIAKSKYGIYLDKNEDMTKTVAISEPLFLKIKSDNILQHVSEEVISNDLSDKCLYPFSTFFSWNRDNYGPVVVPKKGMTIKMCLKYFVFYRYLLEKFEGVKVIYKDGSFFSNGKPIEHYTFKGDYYFVLNDYRDDVSDSRTFGLVKSELILGKYFMKFDFE